MTMQDAAVIDGREALHKTTETSQDTQKHSKGPTDEAKCCRVHSTIPTTPQAGRGQYRTKPQENPQAAILTGRVFNRQVGRQGPIGSQSNRQESRQAGPTGRQGEAE